jgi:ElaB/YqjD/DUF883 family membrane-anchored ribosome-binding protein
MFYLPVDSSLNEQANKQMKDQSMMDKQRQAINNDLSTLAEDARALMAATADVAGDKVADARKRVAAALDTGKEAYGRVRDRAIEGAKAADREVRDHPYESIGIAFGIGALIGFLVGRK